MKKLAIIFVLSIFSIVLIACGKQPKDVAPAIPEQVNQVTVEETTVAEPTPEVTEAITNTTDEKNEEPVIAEEPSDDSDNVIDEDNPYSFTDMDTVKYAKSTLNVRDIPDKEGNKLGSLSQNTEIKITGQCNETSWYRIDYEGGIAYVSNEFVIDEIAESNTQTEKTTADASASSASKGKNGYNIIYKVIAQGTYYTDEAGLMCIYVEPGFTGSPHYTAAGIKANYPLDQIFDNGDGTVSAWTCGCCPHTAVTDGIPGYLDRFDALRAQGYVNSTPGSQRINWVGAADYGHNLSLYTFSK